MLNGSVSLNFDDLRPLGPHCHVHCQRMGGQQSVGRRLIAGWLGGAHLRGPEKGRQVYKPKLPKPRYEGKLR